MNKFAKLIKDWVPTLLIAVVLSLLVRSYVAEAMSVPTESMVPTIQVGDRLIVDKMLWATSLKHGDIVVFHPPIAGETKLYVKRLIGLPGDVVQIKDGALYRNGVKADESYLKVEMDYSFGPVTVPDDHYFFLGDNRNISFDAHLWDTPFVSKDKLIGKVVLEIPVHKLLR
ncbi:signal peptidase I [Paenibacillus sp. URB8-2]|uniref:signal peptidase I n=1 Tax=Paenibacillus sp. URB8-2 TaxID=2741301 RepID=UPI0015C22B6C|nr:signal peptidase I [Paenibacillus sp. URB8-2]BCG58858.1 S26 family signal peptidase [Paenibacillus sp. URB8-2]